MTTYYDVELLRQEQNPICWLASCAMVKGYATNRSVGIADLTDGFDPYNSCIANLAGSWSECTDLMESWGFAVYRTNNATPSRFDGATLDAFMQDNGPIVLLHRRQGFPYGAQWGTGFPPDAAHAVVLTGVDVGAQSATFNNPWGDKDQTVALNSLIAKINADAKLGKTLGVWAVST
jgi:hypothetical protein